MPLAIRCASILVGLTFATTAIAKAVDYYGFIEKAVYYRSFSYTWLHVGAWTTILFEVLLAGLFLGNLWLRCFSLLAAGLMLSFFTGLIIYTWATYGIDDCACLGSLAETTPHAAIAKNIILLALVFLLGWHRKSLPTVSKARLAWAGIPVLTALLATVGLILHQTHGWF